MQYRGLLLVGLAALAFAAHSPARAADEGAKIVDEVCSKCHTPTVRPIDKMHFSRPEWSEAIDRMEGYGAEVPKAKKAELLDYLARNYGPEKK